MNEIYPARAKLQNRKPGVWLLSSDHYPFYFPRLTAFSLWGRLTHFLLRFRDPRLSDLATILMCFVKTSTSEF